MTGYVVGADVGRRRSRRRTVRDRLAGLRAAGAGHLVMGPVGDDPIGEISQLARVLERA